MYHDGFGRESVGRKELFFMQTPVDRRHLGGSLECVKACASSAIPDVDRCVVSASARGQEGRLPRTPTQRLGPPSACCKANHNVVFPYLNGCSMVSLCPFWGSPSIFIDVAKAIIPNVDHVIIPAASE